MKTEQVLQHAEIAATFFRALVTNGVPVSAAVSLTGNYILSIAVRESGNEPPREPWEGS